MLHANGGRGQLRRLDSYLGMLETEIELGEGKVNASLAVQLSSDVRGIVPGMSIVAALDAVFAAQESCMSANTDHSPEMTETRGGYSISLLGDRAVIDPTVGEENAMCETEARELTVRIREASANLCLLLLKAHEGRAWMSLGYRTWEGYVRSEFALSRSRAYELLDQGRVRRALCIAAGTEDVPPVPARTAALLRPVLGELVTRVRQRIAEEGGDKKVVLSRVLRETCTDSSSRRAHADGRTISSGASTRPTPSVHSSQSSDTRPSELGTVLEAIECIANLSPSETLASLSPSELQRLEKLPIAAQRLNSLASIWLELTGRPKRVAVVPLISTPDRAGASPEYARRGTVRHAGHGAPRNVSRKADLRDAGLATIR